MIALIIAGISAIAALVASRWKKAGDYFKIPVLFMALITAGLLFQTAHLGGQIRHTEIRSASMQGSEQNNQDPENNSQETDDD